MEIFRGRSLSLKIAQASLRKPPRSVFTRRKLCQSCRPSPFAASFDNVEDYHRSDGIHRQKVPCDKAPAWWASVDNAGPRTFYNTIGPSQSSPKYLSGDIPALHYGSRDQNYWDVHFLLTGSVPKFFCAFKD